MATEADLIQKFKDLNIPVGADFEELIHEAFIGANLVDKVENHDSRIATVENNLDATKGSIQSNTNQLATKADDSKVLHSTVTDLNSTDMNTVLTAGFYRLVSGTNGMPNLDAWAIYQVIPLSGINGVQVAFGTNHTILGMRSWNSTGGNLNFANWIQFADDSKVAHNSGNEEIGGQKIFDTAPIDKATGKPYSTKDDVITAVNSATENVAYQNKDNNFTGNLLYKGAEVATVDLLQNFYQADDDNTARQKAESLTTPGFVWFSENEKIPAGTVLSMTGTGYSTDTTTNIGLVDNLLADFSNVPTGIQLNFSSDVWLNTISAKMGTLADFKITPTTLQIPKNNIYISSSSNAISLPLPGITSFNYKSTTYKVDKSQANCNIYNNGGVLTFNRILGGFGSGDTTHYYLLSIDSITAY